MDLILKTYKEVSKASIMVIENKRKVPYFGDDEDEG